MISTNGTTPLHVDDIPAVLRLAQTSELYTPAQLELIETLCVGFASGQRVDDYEVIVSRKDKDLNGFLIFRKRSLTKAAFEIGYLGGSDDNPLSQLLETLRQEALSRGGKLIFTELPDLPKWQLILAVLQNAGYILAGETPHLYAPGLGTRHYALHFDQAASNQPQMPAPAPEVQAILSPQPTITTTLSVVPTVREHRSAILDMTAATSVFTTDDQAVVQELLDLYLEKGLSEGYFFLSCLDGNHMIAYTCFGPRPATVGTYDLYWICTNARRRQQGAGRRLMAVVEEQALERNGYLVVLETSSTLPFTPTRKFYEALGYSQIVHIEKFYSDDDGLVVYAKYLKPMTNVL